MPTFKSQILPLLNAIKGRGSFVSHHVASFEFPGLEVKGVGEIAFPINETQAELLIKNAHKAPYGQGSNTLVDSEVRSCWEIDASNLIFAGKGWNKFLDKVLKKIKPDLGIEDYEISAGLYKLLIYEKGDFFLPHKDSEKESGMFGTLTITLPSYHSGGELIVNFDGKQEVIDFAEDAANFKLPFAAFYADCEHEIKPLTSGYRVCLVYNLVQQKAANTIKLDPLEEHAKNIAALLKQEVYDRAKPFKIILLGHQYTPENFSLESLKLNDRSKAEALLRAADKAGHYAKPALVTSYQMGMPDTSYYNDVIDENTIMEEVYDDYLSIEHWMKEGVPGLDISFEEDDLIASFKLNEGEPIIKESEGYMGNYGPELMYWYHYGAIILWPKKHQTDILYVESTNTKLAWLAYYNQEINNLTDEERTAAEFILLSDLSSDGREKTDFTPVVDWLIHKHDKLYFAQRGNSLLLQYFENMSVKQLAILAETYPAEFTKTLDDLTTREPQVSFFDHFILLLNALISSPNTNLSTWVATRVETLPERLAALTKKKNDKAQIIKKNTWSSILALEKKLPQNDIWIAEMASLITTCRDRDYINYVLAAEVISTKQRTPLANAVLKICKEDLQQRVTNKPEPPANWIRDLPEMLGYPQQHAVLLPFMQSPDQIVLNFSKNESERKAMGYAIRSVQIDVKSETIRQGSPYTLRITKTDGSYRFKLAMWNEDKALLEKVENELSA